MNAMGGSFKNVIRNRNFSLLWAGQGISILGDQFEMIAAPWLVLKISNDPLALGTVMALSSIPRALFMLLGGAVSDRFSPRRIMLASDGLRLLLCAGLAGLIFSGRVELWMLYVFSGLFGLVSGFFSPAAGSMVPYLLERGQLQAGNSLMQGTAQLTNFIGPVLGAILTMGSTSQDAGVAALLLVAYSAGLAIPFLAAAVALPRLRPVLNLLRSHGRWVQVASGIFIMAMGVLILTNAFARMAGLFTFL